MIRWTFVEVAEAGSTQTVARDLAERGEPEGTTVVATSQSAAQGRLGRPWISPPGGLYMSFILRPGKISRPHAIPTASAVAVMQGINTVTGLAARIKWPNDVMIGTKKAGSVFAEAQIFKGQVTLALVAVGVNCNTPTSMLEDAREVATSLNEQLRGPVDVLRVRQSILESFARIYERLKAGEDLTPVWTRSIGTVGKSVSIKMKTYETPFSYDAIGVAPEGGLIVSSDGAKAALYPEDIEWLRENP